MNVENKRLYEKVKREAKAKFTSWPSAYASAWLVKEYKRRGGTYSGQKAKDKGLSRWFREDWVDVCTGKKCGRSKSDVRKYPYCRPTKKITNSTPKLASQLTAKEKKSICAKKRKNPQKKIRN